ncbi:MAG TPA: methyltransferase domain-containing protein [Nitratidesulfovibrio sp.]|nr:methyltransferase domain-containing protein [Nitratidesulfovibrio sp.]
MDDRCPRLAGGNDYEDLRVDLPAAYALQDAWLSTMPRRSHSRPAAINLLRFWGAALLQKSKRLEALAMTGVARAWFDEFNAYWENCLGGRPLNVADFHALRHAYRVRFQRRDEFKWGDAAQHVVNWQAPANIYSTLSYVYGLAVRPLRGHRLLAKLKPGMRVLEYGCSLAPYYRNWRDYYSHVRASWVLMDIANFPFHYARYAYAQDAAVENMAVIPPECLDVPLDGMGMFDVIVITTVFEHLHKPLTVAKHLLEHLNRGGMFVFDYILSDAEDLDTPMGLLERNATLQFLKDVLVIEEGDMSRLEGSVGLCIGRKR